MARIAARSGVDAIGLVFAESPRKVSVELAREIAAVLHEEVLKVGVFVNAEPAEIFRIVSAVGLDWVQLHGDEEPEIVSAMQVDGIKVIKAVRVREAASLNGIDTYGADLYLLDAYNESVRGGTGEKFDWRVAKSVRGRGNIVISGGLGPENVREAIRIFEPCWVDASSSLESAPGKKEPDLVRRFISAARG